MTLVHSMLLHEAPIETRSSHDSRFAIRSWEWPLSVEVQFGHLSSPGVKLCIEDSRRGARNSQVPVIDFDLVQEWRTTRIISSNSSSNNNRLNRCRGNTNITSVQSTFTSNLDSLNLSLIYRGIWRILQHRRLALIRPNRHQLPQPVISSSTLLHFSNSSSMHQHLSRLDLCLLHLSSMGTIHHRLSRLQCLSSSNSRP